MTPDDRPAFLRDRPVQQAPSPARPRREGSRQRGSAGHVPGEIGLWVFILADMTIFGVFFVAFLVERGESPAQFAASRRELTTAVGAVNTFILLTSSLLVATAVRSYREGAPGARAPWLVLGAGGCGLAFAALKLAEWLKGLSSGLTPSGDTFFTFYYALTGVHYLHVLIGLAALGLMWRTMRRPGGSVALVEGAASYWHMVDLLWVVLFALLYLAAT